MADLENLREDAGAWPVMEALLGCLEAEFTKSKLGPISFLTIFPGNDVSVYIGGENVSDDACLQVWVRLSQGYPSVQFPQPEVIRANVQRPLAYELEIGALRCMSVGESDGEGAEAAEHLEAARLQLADMTAMKRAICQCLKDLERVYVLESYDPTGPLGGIVGGTWGVLVQYAP